MSDKNKVADQGNIGLGLIYGAGVSGIATFAYAAATGNKSVLLLAFMEAGIALVGTVKSIRAHGQLNQTNDGPSTPNGPGG